MLVFARGTVRPYDELENTVWDGVLRVSKIACWTVLLNLEARDARTPSYAHIKIRVYNGVLENPAFILGRS